MQAGESVTFLVVSGNGEVLQTVQRILSPAPAFKGMQAYWTDQSVLVVRASKRYETGVRVDGRWRRRAGLVIEKGEWFTETDERSELQAHVKKLRAVHERQMRAWARASAVADGGA